MPPARRTKPWDWVRRPAARSSFCARCPLVYKDGGTATNKTAQRESMPTKAKKRVGMKGGRPRSAAAKRRYVYAFGKKTDGSAGMRDLLGGKGANLAEMASIGLPVPPGFTISTEVCTYYYANEASYPASLKGDVEAAIAAIERQQRKGFGDHNNPLLLSVRSGARESMPGMMDTILNLGLNDETVEGLAAKSGNPRFAYDCYRRFIQMYGEVVMGVQGETQESHDPFDALMEERKAQRGTDQDTDLTTADLEELVGQYKHLIKVRTRKNFRQNVYDQLWGAIGAVFGSWKNERAVIYRQRYGIPTEWGTAVSVQAMVFGNLGDDSATGVAFTRDPANGANVFYGEYLVNAQGEDVVAGMRTPKPIAAMAKEMPRSYKELLRVRAKLERHFRDMQDLEFTIENGRLFVLQTRNGKRTGLAAIRIAVEMTKQRLMDQRTALLKIPAESIDSLLVPVFDEKALKAAKPIGKGLPAGPGAASGQIVFTAASA